MTGNDTASRGIEQFTDGLAEVYRRMAVALKPGGPLVFTYHHNKVDAYAAVGVAILDAGLTCSATLPCPAEMGGSIHIHGTGSSIVDTVFVCRTRDDGAPPVADDGDGIVAAVAQDIADLKGAGRIPPGAMRDVCCWGTQHGWRCGIVGSDGTVARTCRTSCGSCENRSINSGTWMSWSQARSRRVLRRIV